jgi:hypothetical protein
MRVLSGHGHGLVRSFTLETVSAALTVAWVKDQH